MGTVSGVDKSAGRTTAKLVQKRQTSKSDAPAKTEIQSKQKGAESSPVVQAKPKLPLKQGGADTRERTVSRLLRKQHQKNSGSPSGAEMPALDKTLIKVRGRGGPSTGLAGGVEKQAKDSNAYIGDPKEVRLAERGGNASAAYNNKVDSGALVKQEAKLDQAVEKLVASPGDSPGDVNNEMTAKVVNKTKAVKRKTAKLEEKSKRYEELNNKLAGKKLKEPQKQALRRARIDTELAAAELEQARDELNQTANSAPRDYPNRDKVSAVVTEANQAVEVARENARDRVGELREIESVPAHEMTEDQANQTLQLMQQQGYKGISIAKNGAVTLGDENHQLTTRSGKSVDLIMARSEKKGGNYPRNLNKLDPRLALALTREVEWAADNEKVTGVVHQGDTGHVNPYGDHNTGHAVDIKGFVVAGDTENPQLFEDAHEILSKEEIAAGKTHDWKRKGDGAPGRWKEPPGVCEKFDQKLREEIGSNKAHRLGDSHAGVIGPTYNSKHRDHLHVAVSRTKNQQSKSKAFNSIAERIKEQKKTPGELAQLARDEGSEALAQDIERLPVPRKRSSELQKELKENGLDKNGDAGALKSQVEGLAQEARTQASEARAAGRKREARKLNEKAEQLDKLAEELAQENLDLYTMEEAARGIKDRKLQREGHRD